MEFNLKGKNAIVTGGASGIGLACCKELAKEGVNVLVADLNEAALVKAVEELKEYGVEVNSVVVDVTSSDSVKMMVKAAKEKMNSIDILINSAGIVTISKLLDLPEKDYDKVMSVNAKGVFLCDQEVLNEMVNSNTKGKIVNISSQAAKKPVNFEGHYSISKAAVNMITQCFAMEAAPYGINVNAVCPGSVANALNNRITEERARLMGIDASEYLSNTLKNTPLKRQAKVEEIAYLAVFLCSDKADFMTGQAINITGGRVLY